MAADLFTIVLAVLTTARLTRLITADRIAEPIRQWASTKDTLGYLVSCDWCVSVYFGLAVALSAWEYGTEPWWIVIAGGLSASYATGWLATLEPES